MCGIRSIQVKLVDLGSAHRVTKLGTKVPVLGHLDYICKYQLIKINIILYQYICRRSTGSDERGASASTNRHLVARCSHLHHALRSTTFQRRRQSRNQTKHFIRSLPLRTFIQRNFPGRCKVYYVDFQTSAKVSSGYYWKPSANYIPDFSKRPSPEECHENRWLLPTDHMIKKRERAVFLGNRLKVSKMIALNVLPSINLFLFQEYSEEYHAEKIQEIDINSPALSLSKGIRSHSIQEELLTAP